MRRVVQMIGLALLGLPVVAQGMDMSTLSLAGMGKVVAGDQTKQTLACKNDSISVAGNNNTITLTGNCTQLIVAGNKNKVSVAVVGEIVLSGNNNTVIWLRALKGVKPRLMLTGKANTVSKK